MGASARAYWQNHQQNPQLADGLTYVYYLCRIDRARDGMRMPCIFSDTSL